MEDLGSILREARIKKTLHSIRHASVDETAAELSLQDAARFAGHTSTRMTYNHYAVNERFREMEKIKKVEARFA